MRRLCVVIGLVLALASQAGCGSSLFNQHVKDQEILRGMALETGKQLTDGQGQIAGGAQGINPGIRVAASITYEAVAHYVGLAGQFTFAKQGVISGPLSEADRALVEQIVNDTSLSQAAKREAMMALLNKVADKVLATTQPSVP